MRIKLTRQYMRWPSGSVIDLASGLARTLIDNGRAVSAEAITPKRLAGAPRNKAVRGTEVKHGAC